MIIAIDSTRLDLFISYLSRLICISYMAIITIYLF